MKNDNFERQDFYKINRNASLYGSIRNVSNIGGHPMSVRYRNIHEMFN